MRGRPRKGKFTKASIPHAIAGGGSRDKEVSESDDSGYSDSDDLVDTIGPSRIQSWCSAPLEVRSEVDNSGDADCFGNADGDFRPTRLSEVPRKQWLVASDNKREELWVDLVLDEVWLCRVRYVLHFLIVKQRLNTV